MATTIQFRRGNTAANDAFTGAEGELSYDTSAKKIRIHDGSTAGGKTMAAEEDVGAIVLTELDAALDTEIPPAIAAAIATLTAADLAFAPAGGIAAEDVQAAIEELEADLTTLIVGRNILPNGGFQVAQRGVGPFTSATTVVNNDDAYLLDGCIFLAPGSDTCDISRVADTDFVSGYKIRLDVETNNRRFGVLFPVESRDIQAIRKSGKCSIQFQCKRTGSSLTNVRVYLLAWNGTADAITSDVISAYNAVDTDPTFVASWTAENVASNRAVGTTIDTIRIENISVDTSNVANLALLILSNPTTTTTGDCLDIGDVQIEEGVNATEYEHRPVAFDMAWCQRYYCQYGGAANVFDMRGYNAASALSLTTYTFAIPMRVAPTYAKNGTWAVTNCAQPTIGISTETVFNLYTIVTSLGAFSFVTNSTDDTLTFTAEL